MFNHHALYVLYALFLSVCTCPLISASPVPSAPASSSSLDIAHSAITRLQEFYYPENGTWSSGWWNSANALILLADLRAVDDSSFLTSITDGDDGVFQTVIQKAPSDFLWTSYFDDAGWWTLALIKLYDVTKNSAFLEAANHTFTNIATYATKDVTCVGIWWNNATDKHPAQGNSGIATLLFTQSAAELATRYPEQKSYYIDLAEHYWTYLDQKFLQKDDLFHGDSLNNSPTEECKNDNAMLTYQQGVAIGALLSLAQATGDQSYLDTATAIADATITSKIFVNDGILFEFCDAAYSCNVDVADFKGIFMRNLALLQKVRPSTAVSTFLSDNAVSIWNRNRSGDGQNTLGIKWSGPYRESGGMIQAVAHGSSTMALVAASIDEIQTASAAKSVPVEETVPVEQKSTTVAADTEKPVAVSSCG